MNKNLAQKIIVFSILGIIIGYFLFLTFSNEVDSTPEIYFKYEDPILKKIRDSETAKVQNKLIDTVSIIYFEIGSNKILDSSSILYIAKNNLARTVFVNGHTDNSGLELTNLKLSNKRANSVGELLIHYRCLGSIIGEGFSSKKPVSKDNSMNRRTEILWKKKQ